MKVPVSKPSICLPEKRYVGEALDSNAISGVYGEFIEQFELRFANFCNTKYAVSCSNGTTALHLALAGYGIKEGDEVLVSSLTNMASFFAVHYLNAKPVPVDIDLRTLTMDPEDLSSKINRRTKGVMPVHLFGHPADMGPINEIAQKNGLLVIEDCAEAHGAEYRGEKVGGLGDAGCFSFFANKILTTGEGGMITTNDINLANKARSLKALAFGIENKFMHTDIGFNYRMTNLQAAVGCGQMDRADQLINKRIEISNFYTKELSEYKDYLSLPLEMEYAKNVYWMYHIVLREHLVGKRSFIMNALKEVGIETREGFIPYNLQKIFISKGWTKPEDCPNANKVAYASFYLPTGPDISEEELQYVVKNFKRILKDIV